MKILCDVDGCLLDMLKAISLRHTSFKPSGVVDYGFKTPSYGISREEVFKLLAEKRTFELQKPYRGAKEGITQLKTLGKVYGWTSVPSELVPYRTFQCKKLGLDGQYVYEGDKSTELDGVVAVIEDDAKTLDRWREKGVIRILIDRPYNRENSVGYEVLEGTYRVKNIMESYELLKKLMRNT